MHPSPGIYCCVKNAAARTGKTRLRPGYSFKICCIINTIVYKRCHLVDAVGDKKPFYIRRTGNDEGRRRILHGGGSRKPRLTA